MACNQDVYDGIYRQIIQQALLSRAHASVTFRQRNTAIEALRSLCNGQLSTYERGDGHTRVAPERFAAQNDETPL